MLLLLLFLVTFCLSSPPLGFLPNIIIFYSDDLGFGDLENYGNVESITPSLTQLGNEGIRFTSLYSSSPVCSPSRAALLTGRFQTRSGIYPGVFWPNSIGGLPLNEITIAELLKTNNLNYSTAIIGKWHLGYGGNIDKPFLPTKQGFDFYTGIPYAPDGPLMPPYCFPPDKGCWPDTPIDPWINTNPNTKINDIKYPNKRTGEEIDNYYAMINKGIDNIIKKYGLFVNNNNQSTLIKYYKQNYFKKKQYNMNNKSLSNSEDNGITDMPLMWNDYIIQQPINMTQTPQWYTLSAMKFMNASIINKQPFFLYMAYPQTHHPQYSSIEFFNTTQRGMFGDSLSEMDYNIGLIMDYIRSNNNLVNNTFVFMSADNGPAFMRYSRGGTASNLKCGKGTTYEGGMREPGFIWMPKYIKHGIINRELISMLDIFPTISDLVGINLPNNITYDGYSMYDMLFNNQKSKRNEIFYWPKDPNPNFGTMKSLHACRINQYKLHYIIGGSHADNNYPDSDCRWNNTEHILDNILLFNLYHDIGEKYPINLTENDYYNQFINNINDTVYELLKDKELFGFSQINLGGNDTLAPCCGYPCEPFPDCCGCDEINFG